MPSIYPLCFLFLQFIIKKKLILKSMAKWFKQLMGDFIIWRVHLLFLNFSIQQWCPNGYKTLLQIYQLLVLPAVNNTISKFTACFCLLLIYLFSYIENLMIVSCLYGEGSTITFFHCQLVLEAYLWVCYDNILSDSSIFVNNTIPADIWEEKSV